MERGITKKRERGQSKQDHWRIPLAHQQAQCVYVLVLSVLLSLMYAQCTVVENMFWIWMLCSQWARWDKYTHSCMHTLFRKHRQTQRGSFPQIKSLQWILCMEWSLCSRLWLSATLCSSTESCFTDHLSPNLHKWGNQNIIKHLSMELTPVRRHHDLYHKRKVESSPFWTFHLKDRNYNLERNMFWLLTSFRNSYDLKQYDLCRKSSFSVTEWCFWDTMCRWH